MVKEFNAKLEALYTNHWPNLTKALLNYDPLDNNISNPLLLSVYPEYEVAKTKLMVIGQQTNGWGCWLPQNQRQDIIPRLMKAYDEFALGRKYKYTPFWKVSHEVHQEINPESGGLGFIWNNLIKMDQNGGKPDSEIEQKICDAFPVIIEEINILKPDCVIFFTGYDYDNRMELIFGNLKKIRVDGFIEKELARVEHSCLPFTTFRTYHPKYLRLRRQDIIQKLISLIIQEQNNQRINY